MFLGYQHQHTGPGMNSSAARVSRERHNSSVAATRDVSVNHSNGNQAYITYITDGQEGLLQRH